MTGISYYEKRNTNEYKEKYNITENEEITLKCSKKCKVD